MWSHNNVLSDNISIVGSGCREQGWWKSSHMGWVHMNCSKLITLMVSFRLITLMVSCWDWCCTWWWCHGFQPYCAKLEIQTAMRYMGRRRLKRRETQFIQHLPKRHPTVPSFVVHIADELDGHSAAEGRRLWRKSDAAIVVPLYMGVLWACNVACFRHCVCWCSEIVASW